MDFKQPFYALPKTTVTTTDVTTYMYYLWSQLTDLRPQKKTKPETALPYAA